MQCKYFWDLRNQKTTGLCFVNIENGRCMKLASYNVDERCTKPASYNGRFNVIRSKTTLYNVERPTTLYDNK